ncbi:MAG TPA: pantetheine-phosphate adenylyltransferase [bacterium]|nr:pantetheine-phosphate adenylyltransferase [bacterium]
MTAPHINALYPGSFDPVTLGHLDIIRRAAPLYATLQVAVLRNPSKRTMFAELERVAMIADEVRDLPMVRVSTFDGLLVDYARQCEARVIIRGLRAITDFEYEFQMALMNRTLAPELDTLYMMTSQQFSYVSSQMVKEIARFGGDISALVSPAVQRLVQARIKEHS